MIMIHLIYRDRSKLPSNSSMKIVIRIRGQINYSLPEIMPQETILIDQNVAPD